MAGEIEALAQEVAETLGAEASAVQALDKIQAMLEDALATQDMAKLNSLVQQLKDSRATLAAAIVRDNGTPTPPVPDPTPVPSEPTP